MELFYIVLIIFFSAIIQGLTSFGASLIAYPLLVLFLPHTIVVPLTVTFNLFMNSILYIQLRKDSDLRKIAPLLISGIVFTLFGVFVLKKVDTYYIEIVVAIILIVMSISQLIGFKIKMKNYEKAYIPVGAASGILNGMAGLSGPPVLLFLSNVDLDKMKFRATLTSYFLILNVVSIVLFIVNRIYTFEIVKNVFIYTPILFLGLFIGLRIGDKINDQLFKKIVLVLIGLNGLLLLFT